MKKLLLPATLISIVGASLTATPAKAERRYLTPSGLPEAVFVNTTNEDAAEKLAAICAKVGWMVTREMMAVKCEVKMNLLAQALTNALTAPRYATSVREFVYFSLNQDGRQTRVQARNFQSHTTAFGQYNEVTVGTDDSFNMLMDLMQGAGAVLPIGTSFGNTTWWGIVWKETEASVSGKKTKLVQITSVTPDSPAEKAGVKTGDMLISVNGRPCKDTNSCIKAGKKLKIGEDTRFEILRDNQNISIIFLGVPKPPISELAGCNGICHTPPDKKQIPTNGQSLSDEIEKLNLLFKSGALSKEEFEAAKARVIGGGKN